jgi:uncharacterized protein involved in exopolysaccharide biosynthesis
VISNDPTLPVPYHQSNGAVGSYAPPMGGPPMQQPGNQGFQWQRSVSALLRYKWLVLAMTVAGLGLGIAGSRFIQPEYQAHATIWISTESSQGSRTGPIRSEELLAAASWPQLLRSFEILEKVARNKSLFLTPTNPADSSIFAGFQIADRVRPGTYQLVITDRNRYVLSTDTRQVVDSGAIGDSIGRVLGPVRRE